MKKQGVGAIKGLGSILKEGKITKIKNIMNEEYYAFFEDGTSISKMTLDEALAIPYKEYIIKIERSPH